MGRITLVESRKTSSDPWANIATDIAYQPMSRIVQALWAGNGLSNWNTYTNDYELDLSGVYDGQTPLIEKTHTRTDNLNLTNIWDNVNTANNMSFWANSENMLQNADGPWGAKTFYYDAVGNRTYENTTVSGVTVEDHFQYPSSSNRLDAVVRDGTTTLRTFSYDGAGNILTDTRSGVAYTYTYNNADRLKTVSSSSNLLATYTYNGFDQRITRVITNSGSANGTINTVQDIWGNVIAEVNASGDTVREYIWLPETEIAPTRQGRAQVDRPIAVITAVNTTSQATLYVHVDHLNRPVSMTNASKASVWDAIWTPWGAPYSIIGSETLDARFPGQWFQLEAGLNYNWHRHYDPTTGRYTQPDPLGFVDGPSVYAYVKNVPQGSVDPEGLRSYGPQRPLGPPDIDVPNYIPQLPFLWPLAPPIPETPSTSNGGNSDRTIEWPDPRKRKWVCSARADCNDNIPGNCPDDPNKRFAFGYGEAPDQGTARNIAKSSATHRLQCQPKHVSCKCVGPRGERYSGGC